MERNVGRFDRVLRILGGVVFVLAALAPFAGFLPFRFSSLLLFGIPALLLVVGILLFVTGLTGRSIVYRVFGFETYSPPESDRDAEGSR